MTHETDTDSAVTVKPLAWEEVGFECMSSGSTATGTYYAERTHVGPFFTARRGSLLLSTECMSMQEAIEVCDKENERRVLSTITTQSEADIRADEQAKVIAEALWVEYLRVSTWEHRPDAGHAARCAIRCCATRLRVYSEFCALDEPSDDAIAVLKGGDA